MKDSLYWKEGAFELNDSLTAVFFPNAKISDNENCKRYMVMTSDGNQPTGHVLTKISADSIVLHTVWPKIPCRTSLNFIWVSFLAEFCEEVDFSQAVIEQETYYSDKWNCEISNPTTYGYWTK